MGDKFRSKTPVVEAIEWTGKNLNEVVAFVGLLNTTLDRGELTVSYGDNGKVTIQTGATIVRSKDPDGLIHLKFANSIAFASNHIRVYDSEHKIGDLI